MNKLTVYLIAHRYLYDHLKILHCDLSISNVLLNRNDNESEPIGLLIDYDFLINAEVDAANAHTADDTPIVKGVVAGSDANISSTAFEVGLAAEAGKTQRQTLRTVRLYSIT